MTNLTKIINEMDMLDGKLAKSITHGASHWENSLLYICSYIFWSPILTISITKH